MSKNVLRWRSELQKGIFQFEGKRPKIGDSIRVNAIKHWDGSVEEHEKNIADIKECICVFENIFVIKTNDDVFIIERLNQNVSAKEKNYFIFAEKPPVVGNIILPNSCIRYHFHSLEINRVAHTGAVMKVLNLGDGIYRVITQASTYLVIV